MLTADNNIDILRIDTPKIDTIREVELRRLTWRCRRGMLELDIVLQRFISQYFDQLTWAHLSAFDGLLELPDNDFWILVSTDTTLSNDVDTADVVSKIRALK